MGKLEGKNVNRKPAVGISQQSWHFSNDIKGVE